MHGDSAADYLPRHEIEIGSITIVFFGRQEIAGIRLGTIMSVKGVASDHHGLRAILDPEYDLISTPPAPSSPGHH